MFLFLYMSYTIKKTFLIDLQIIITLYLINKKDDFPFQTNMRTTGM